MTDSHPPAAQRSSVPTDQSVALVHDWLTGMRGGEKVLEELSTLFPGAPIHTLFHFPGSVSPQIESHPIHTSYLQRLPFLERHYRSFLPLFPTAAEQLDLTPYDLVISSSHCVAKGVLPAPGSLHVCYCHTPMRYAWDQEALYFPRRKGPVALLRAQILSSLRTWDSASSHRVDRFVANSRFVAQRIRRYYRRGADVVPPPVDVEWFTPGPAGESEPFALSVAALAPYKRHDLAIEACRKLGLRLIIVGEGPERRRLERMAEEGVELRGRVDGAQLRELYRGARCFVQPGIEDFGIAAVEALACGTPVVALGHGGVTDIVQSEAHGVLYGDGASTERPHAEQVAELMRAVDRGVRLRSNTLDRRARAEAFSPDRFRRRMSKAIEDARGRQTEHRGAAPGVVYEPARLS